MPQFIEGSARKCWIHSHPGVDMEVSKNHLKGECLQKDTSDLLQDDNNYY